MARPTSFDKAIAQLYRDYLQLLRAFGAFGKLVQEAVENIALRQRLVHAPEQVLLEKGVRLPANTEIEFLANTSRRVHLILPPLADKAPGVATPNPVKRAIERARLDIDLVLAAVTFLSSAGLGALPAEQKYLGSTGLQLASGGCA